MVTREGSAHAPPHDTSREEAGLTQIAFSRLLEWLDDGVDSQGRVYLEMRRRLVSYFDRRDRRAADELADETLNRIARTLASDGAIATTPPARYCYVVARFVLLEDIRERLHVPFDEAHGGSTLTRRGLASGGPDDDSAASHEQRLDRLDQCLRQLKAEQYELVVDYYRDAGRERIERRRAMAARLGISMNALGIRACRIRSTLEACLQNSCKPIQI